MHSSNIYEAKTHLSRLIDWSLAGEEVVISKAGKPMVRLIPYREALPERKPGLWKGKVKMSRDFDVLPPHLMAAFKGAL